MEKNYLIQYMIDARVNFSWFETFEELCNFMEELREDNVFIFDILKINNAVSIKDEFEGENTSRD